MRRLVVPLVAALIAVTGSPLIAAVAPIAPAAEARSFGDDPLDDVLAAAQAFAGTCPGGGASIGRDALAAAMLAPSWPETGAPPDQAPSPMTLSRYDDSPLLYAFGRGDTYERAFWHPGVGFWQFDSAGLGAPFTASQRIDTRVIATEMARVISVRYCSAAGAIGPRLAAAWQPWFGCDGGRCASIFVELYNNNTNMLRNQDRIESVLSTGGMQSRTCRGPGASGTFACWRVDPALAQGYAGFANPNFSTRTPITAPFYVYQAGGHEYRHWLPADTGYRTGIWATRQLGTNARNSLTWHDGELLCDVTADRGACCPPLPVNYDCLATSVAGDYVPLAGDYNGDGVDDVLWYAAGGAKDYLWQGTVYGRFVGREITVGATYTPVVGDFDGDGNDDLFWYGPGSDRDYLWYGRNNGSFRGKAVDVTRSYDAVAAADFNGDGEDDILWYKSGAGADYVWHGGGTGFSSRTYAQDGAGLVPLAANYDGDTRADVFWYGPGDADDEIWFGQTGRVFTVSTTTIGGEYRPLVGRLNPGRKADILWYTPTTASDVLYLGQADRSFAGRPAAIDAPYEAFTGDFNGDGTDDVFWYAPGGAPDSITLGG